MKFDDTQAIYMQIAEHMSEQILTHKWQEGERIPSVREIAKMLEVNPNTVMRSFAYLQERGIIENQRGIGYFVANTVIDAIKKDKKAYFEKNDLPKIFHQAKILGYSCKQIGELYQHYLDSTDEINK